MPRAISHESRSHSIGHASFGCLCATTCPRTCCTCATAPETNASAAIGRVIAGSLAGVALARERARSELCAHVFLGNREQNEAIA